MEAALDEARNVGLPDLLPPRGPGVSRMNALTTARWGLTSSEPSYGLPGALRRQGQCRAFPSGYHYNDEYLRFSTAGTTFLQAAKPSSAKWEEVLDAFIEAGHTFVPTMNVYDANRDLMRTRRASWHERFTAPNLLRYFEPHRGGRSSYWYRWSTQNEVEWRETFHFNMDALPAGLQESHGGRVCAGSDSGFMPGPMASAMSGELELLQEAGFNPLEVLRAATAHGADLHRQSKLWPAPSKSASGRTSWFMASNPLDDFKLLYGTGALETRRGEAARQMGA
ncbi:hypothetical protein ACTMU2_41540 [Cupriavidus basilensis]